MAKDIVGKLVWSHHPRGGFITGYAGPIKSGLYSKERVIATTAENAKDGNGYSVPASQVYVGEPPKSHQ